MSSVPNPDPRFSPGLVLGGKFRVLRVLGQGGMGIVLAAHHLVLDQPVALKILLPPEEGEREQAVERFLREARSLAQLHSAHVARVLDVGALDDGLPFMVMELLDGEDLQSTLDREGYLTVSAAASAILHACDALAEAHGRGLVHRDLKPANLFLARTAEGQTILKIIDFGIAKSTVRADYSLTSTKTMVGSPLYMSPEQVKSPKMVDTRSDIWALGCVLHELVTGRAPFLQETIGEIFAAILQAPIPPASSLNFSVPPALDEVIARCLSRDLDRRFQSVQEVAAALRPFASPEASLGRAADESAPRLLVTGPQPFVSGRTGPAGSGVTLANTVLQTSSSQAAGASPGRWVAAGVAALAVACAIALVGVRSLRSTARASSTAQAVQPSSEVFAPLAPPHTVEVSPSLTSASDLPVAAGAAPASAPPAASSPLGAALAVPARSPTKPQALRPPAVASTPRPTTPSPTSSSSKRSVDVLEGRD